jgi:hypothetical protein
MSTYGVSVQCHLYIECEGKYPTMCLWRECNNVNLVVGVQYRSYCYMGMQCHVYHVYWCTVLCLPVWFNFLSRLSCLPSVLGGNQHDLFLCIISCLSSLPSCVGG